MINKADAIKSLLTRLTHNDLSNLYNINMECQVNVSQDQGEEIQGEFNGKTWRAFTDNIQTWKSFRIPYKANSDPEYTDSEIKFDLDAHALGIGMTGWDWKNRVSKWVAFDFDAIVGHSDRHTNKLSPDELKEVENLTCDIPWVTTRLSTSGNGLHLYVFLPDVPTSNHTEHAALGRAILHMMSAKAGYNFESKVDIVGGNMWVWHRKMKGTPGLKLIKQGGVLTEIPENWREHIGVTSGNRRIIKPPDPNSDEEKFLEITGQLTKIKLESKHRELLDYLEKSSQYSAWWDDDHHMLVCHSLDIQAAHAALNMKGVFKTLSTASTSHNCFCFPLRKGAWVVRRYGPGTSEAETWNRDAAGYTYCYLNKDPDLRTLAMFYGGIEHSTGGFVFKKAELAQMAALALGVEIKLPPDMIYRECKLKINKDGKLVADVERKSSDRLDGWLDATKDKWTKVYHAPKSASSDEVDVSDFDDIVRHVIASDGTNGGWMIKSETQWVDEPLSHVQIALKSLGLKDNDAKAILGNNVFKPWKLTNRPFEDEYPGDRQWNRDAAQFRYAPDYKKEQLEYPFWKSILRHVGQNLDTSVKENAWCKANGIVSGSDYLKCWCASLFQFPFEPLPYIFMYGEQNSGKSIFHEALSLLMTRGYKRADQALKSTSGFNGELWQAILCVIEETSLRENKAAYNYIKDFVTAVQISIHVKGKTPFMAMNSTHWIQCSNERDDCPVFEGDSRILMINVPPLLPEQTIAKRLLINHLQKEAPDFLAACLKLELPECNDRLRIPLLETSDKLTSINNTQNLLEQFIKEECHFKAGHRISVADFFGRFQMWLDPIDRMQWSKHKISRRLPSKFLRGRGGSDPNWYYGNISFDANAVEGTPYALHGETLKQC